MLTVVVDAAQTRDVLFVECPFRAPVVMMCSTIAPGDSEDIARNLADVSMLDAPISGGPARAHAGTLSVMASGSDAAFERCKPVLEAMASRVFRISDRPGDGSRMKVVNNMLAAANLAAGCEAMAMAARLGLDLKQAADVVNASSGGSWIFADRMARALEGDYAPRAAARVLLKDVGLFVGEARNLGLTATMAECARDIFHDTVARGYAEEDDAAVLKRYADAWGAEIP
jgi:putative dehydrogenase